MDDAVEEESASGYMDHGLGHVEVLLVVANKAAPADHPPEGAHHDSASWDELEAHRLIGAAEDLDHGSEEGEASTYGRRRGSSVRLQYPTRQRGWSGPAMYTAMWRLGPTTRLSSSQPRT